MGTGSRERDFDAFVGARAAALLRTAYLTTGAKEAAEDLLTGALARTHLGWRGIDGPESVEFFTRRELLTAAHARAQPDAPRGAAQSEGLTPDVTDGRKDLDDEDPLGSGPLWRALASLPPNQRVTLVLAVHDDLTDEEIARAVGTSGRSVRAELAAGFAAVTRQLPSGGDSQVVVARLRTALVAHQDDVRPPTGLADHARDVAEQRTNRRRRRILAAAAAVGGLLVVAALGSVIVGSTPADSADPAVPTPTDSLGSRLPTAPASVFRLALENSALVAYGSLIVDGGSGSSVVLVRTDGGVDPGRERVEALARAAGGYVVRTSAGTPSDPGRASLAYVRRDGYRAELGLVSKGQNAFVVSADGLTVVHVVSGPVVGENALADEESELVVQSLAGDVVNRITVKGEVRPLYLDADRVWFERIEPNAGPPLEWDRDAGRIVPARLPPNEVALDARGDELVLLDLSGTRCLVAMDAVDPGDPRPRWRRCPDFSSARLDPQGGAVAAISGSAGLEADLLVLDARTGLRDYGTDLGSGTPAELAWTSDSRLLVVVYDDKGPRYVSVEARPGDGLKAPVVANYRVDGGPVVLGTELPLPVGG
ncbi:MAG TPA: sigma factor-like helix-turn-helix DNA-binding protein [Candidatus Limnocylindria bacterium]|nr:sigma factor-like helix-turn-helix DNA-binding protein [Candidatus Limnocylindria bacterium]